MFESFTAERSRFERCDFASATIDYGPLGLRGSVFCDCRFDGADLRGVDPGDARLERCTFVDTKIKDWFAFCAEFVECHFATRIVGCKFSGTPFQCQVERERNEFRGNDFRAAELIDTSFVMGIDLSAQLLPESDDYVYLDRIAERLEHARALVREWPDGEERHLALSELETLEFLAKGQSEIFTRRDAPLLKPPARDRLWDLLTNG